jgi:uncharacterized membrane protein YjjB (DUF3815 family)
LLSGGVLTTATARCSAISSWAERQRVLGALVMTPVALAVAQFPAGPPSQVTFLPALWLLVPGALGSSA